MPVDPGAGRPPFPGRGPSGPGTKFPSRFQQTAAWQNGSKQATTAEAASKAHPGAKSESAKSDDQPASTKANDKNSDEPAAKSEEQPSKADEHISKSEESLGISCQSRLIFEISASHSSTGCQGCPLKLKRTFPSASGQLSTRRGSAPWPVLMDERWAWRHPPTSIYRLIFPKLRSL